MAEHFKKMVGTPTHAGIFILPDGKDIEYIVIDHLEERKQELVMGVKKDCVVAYFKPNPYTNLGMIMNVVNSDRACKLARKTGWQMLEIKDLPIRLTSEPTQKGDGLRISKTPAVAPAVQPRVLPKVTESNFAGTLDYLKANSMAALKLVAEVSEEMERRLIEKMGENG